jgi:predicted nucleic acid-binding protein
MKAVSNTTPLRYLIAIEQEHLLGQLFEKVFVPVAVHEELTDSRTPETVRRRVLALPAWFLRGRVVVARKNRVRLRCDRRASTFLMPRRAGAKFHCINT